MLAGYRMTLFVIAGCLALPATAETLIRKCQDSEGRWHYYEQGTPEGCARSVVYVLDEDGRVIDQEAPPLTSEELAAKAEVQAALEVSEKQRSADQVLVQSYGSLELLRNIRDRKLGALERRMRTTEQIRAGLAEDLEELRARNQTDEIRAEIEYREQLLGEHSRVIEQSEQEYERVIKEYTEIERQYVAAADRLRQGGN